MGEKLLIKSNGQWELLTKGSLQRRIGKPKDMPFQQFATEAYQPVKDKATQERGQLELLKQFMNRGNPNAFKKINGKMHVLLHRGIDPDQSSNDQASPMSVSSKGDLSHSGYGMYTDDHGYASSFAGKKGETSSVWVPLDSVNSNAHYRQTGAENRMKEQDPEKLNELQEADYGEVLGRGNHLLVNPGSYEHASPEEIAAFHSHVPQKSATVREPIVASQNLFEGSISDEGDAKGAKWQGSDPKHSLQIKGEPGERNTRAGNPVATSSAGQFPGSKAATSGVSSIGYDRVETGKPVKLAKNNQKPTSPKKIKS